MLRPKSVLIYGLCAVALLATAARGAAPGGAPAADNKRAESKAPDAKAADRPAKKDPLTLPSPTRGEGSGGTVPSPTSGAGSGGAPPSPTRGEGNAAAKPVAPLPGHSTHGEAFDEGPRQSAYLMGGTGKVHLPITTKNPQAQEFFDQGVGQLHGFWYFEAERSFRQVAALDPDCAMAYWGMAMANVNNDKRAKEFIEKAVEHKATASPREQLWIDAWPPSTPTTRRTTRRAAATYVRDLEKIVHEYPDDVEAKAFLAVQIWKNVAADDTADHQPPGRRRAVGRSLRRRADAPGPSLPHSSVGRREAGAGAQSAARCGQSAPGIAHMWHMPGHIYSNLHRYADAAWQQEASARVDHAHMMRDRVLPDQIHNYAHNNEWLIRDLVFVGRVHDAVELAKNMIELPRHPKYNTTSGGSAQFGRTRLFEVLSRYELWDETIALADTVYLEPTDAQDQQIKRLRLLGAAYFGKGDVVRGKQQIAALDATLAPIKSEQKVAGDAAETKIREEQKAAELKPPKRSSRGEGGGKEGRRCEGRRDESRRYETWREEAHGGESGREETRREGRGWQGAGEQGCSNNASPRPARRPKNPRKASSNRSRTPWQSSTGTRRL